MIWQGLFDLITLPIVGLLTLLSALPSPPDLSGYIADLGTEGGPVVPILQWVKWLNYYVPLDSVFAVSGIVLTVFGIMYGIRGTLWVLQRLHISG